MPVSDVCRLVKPSMTDAQAIQIYRATYLAADTFIHGSGSLTDTADVAAWLEHIERASMPETCGAGRVPATQLIYVRQTDRKVVGMINIRHTLNDFLRTYYGHIGYSVAPDERCNGYATRMLQAAWPICRSLGLTRVMICCDANNGASRAVILKAGGHDMTHQVDPDGDLLERYWVDVPSV